MRMLILLALGSACVSALGQTQLVLNKAWMQRIQNRATLDIQMEVDHTLSRPHKIASGGDDGDIHFSGRSPDVGLPMVAEIMNAGSEPTALSDLMKDANGTTVPVSGAWRIWFEHPGGDQVQGEDVVVPADTNPDHVFEIHPLLKFAGDSVLDSFVPIPGYKAYDAETACGQYERQQATIQSDDTSVTISAKKIGYNYTHFRMELAGAPSPSDDGGVLVLAKVMQDGEESIVSDLRRMVFSPGTPPAAVIVN